MSYANYASEVLSIAQEAAELIMGFYNSSTQVAYKDDNSPVTDADIAANNFIKNKLLGLSSIIPVVSEENTEEENRTAASNELFWLVDPLDGTKSFIRKTGEFTVNIALIKSGLPQGGVVYIPAQNTAYFTAHDGDAYKQIANNSPEKITARCKPNDKVVVVASKSHMTPQTEEYIANLGVNVTLISAASSLKFCMIAEGKADLYPRFGNTMEWDTAAGHAILIAAGGHIERPDGTPLLYSKEGFLNPFFIAKGMV